MASTLNTVFSCPKDASCFRAAYFQPTFSKYNNTVVSAVQWLHERVDLKIPSNGYGSSLGDAPSSSVFDAAVKVLIQMKALSSPPEAFVWDGSWFGHPGTELVDMYAGT